SLLLTMCAAMRTNDFLRLLTQAQELFPYRCMRLFDRFTGSTDVKSGSLVRGLSHFRDLLVNPLTVCTTLRASLTSGFAHFSRSLQVRLPFRGRRDDIQGVRDRPESHPFAHT